MSLRGASAGDDGARGGEETEIPTVASVGAASFPRTISPSTEHQSTAELCNGKGGLRATATAKAPVAKQVYALFHKHLLVRFKGFGNAAVTVLEVLIPLIFFFLLSLTSIIPRGEGQDCIDGEGIENSTAAAAGGATSSSAAAPVNCATSLTKFNKQRATVGEAYPVMDIRWIASNETDIANYCSNLAGAGHSETDIYAMFGGADSSPRLSPAYRLLFTPNDTEHTRVARKAAKSLLCSRSLDENFSWELKNLNMLTGDFIPATVLGALPFGDIFTANRTSSYMETVLACNYLNYLFNGCVLKQSSLQDDFFSAVFGNENAADQTENSDVKTGDRILDILSNFIKGSSDEALQVIECITGVTSDSHPQLRLLEAILRENPCRASCLEDEECISEALDEFLQGFGSEDDAMDYVYENPTEVMGLVSFEEGVGEPSIDKTSLKYKLRVNGTDIAPVSESFLQWKSVGQDNEFTFWKGYYSFVNIQHSVDKALSSWLRDNLTEGSTAMDEGIEASNLLLSPYPTWSFSTQSLETVATFGMGILFVAGFLATVILQLYTLVFEKQTHLQDFQFIMGLKPWCYWVTHFVLSYIPQMFIAVGVAFVAGSAWPYGALRWSDWTVLIVFFLVWQTSLTAFTAFMSIFFDKVTIACISGTLGYMLSCLPGILVTFLYPGGNVAWVVVGVLPASNVWVFSQVLMQLENVSSGTHWYNLSLSLYNFHGISVQTLMIMAACDFFLYIFLLYFCMDKRYLSIYEFVVGIPQACRGRSKAREGITLTAVASEGSDIWALTSPPTIKGISKTNMYQKLETLQIPTVQILDLKKRYYNKTVALKGLNLSLYEGEVTALLGSNGAGKTTTISILTGRLSATSGDALILGQSVLKDMSLIRRAMGVCTQHDSLWPLMTVKEHMVFFSHIKGLPESEIMRGIHRNLAHLKILHQMNTLSKDLSGGQRRKLNLALAILGDPYLILLDEPSTGMDPQSRRDTWSFIERAKENRVILLTTHYMDEAEELGDRIAIMAHGQLQCWGTPSYLQAELKLGYQLRFLCESGQEHSAKEKIESIVSSHVKEANSQPIAGTEFKILIPDSERKNFPAMLEEIKTKEPELNIQSFELACTTLEDIFLHVIDSIGGPKGLDESTREYEELEDRVHRAYRRAPGHNHFAVLLWKRYVNQKRDLQGFLTQLGATLVMIIIGLALLWKAIDGGIPKKQSPVTMSAERNLYAPPKPIPVGQNSVDGQLELENLERFYVDEFELSYNTTRISQQEFQKNLVKSIDDQRISCYQSPSQTCSALYFEDSDNGTAVEDPLRYTLFFSQSALHSPAASLNLFDAYTLRTENGENVSLELVNQPLPLVGVQEKGNIQAYIQVTNLSFTCIVLGAALLASSFSVYVTYEKRFQSNELQILSGTPMIVYHLSNYIWDLAYFLVVYGCILIALFAMPTNILYNFSLDALQATVLLFLLFGPASIGLAYLCQRPFRNDMVSYGAILGVNALTGLIMFDLVSILIAFSFPNFKQGSIPVVVLTVLEWIFPLNPIFALARGFFEVTWFSFYYQYPITCKNVFRCSVYTPYKEGNSVVTRCLAFLAGESVIYIALFLLLETGVLSPSSLGMMFGRTRGIEGVRAKHAQGLDEDVQAESDRVMGMQVGGADLCESFSSFDNRPDTEGHRDLVLCRDLWVAYGRRVVIKGLSFGLKESQCFGLLGMNGAGKTSLFRVLTGSVTVTHGEVLVHSEGRTVDLLKHQRKSKLVGYCPQSDAILPRLTVLEQLQLYGVIKGESRAGLPERITKLVSCLGLGKYLHQQTGNLSGGNRRKVSVAVALIGDPALVLLDEPSAGLDPKARRSLWNAITESTRDKTVVLTSHSMEECEALCDYIGILKEGQLVSFGTLKHIKTRFDGSLEDIFLNFAGGIWRRNLVEDEEVEGVEAKLEIFESYRRSKSFEVM